jgi:hypothetical protein
MRSTRLLFVLAAVGGSACGDNELTPIDAAPPDMGGLGTQCDDGVDNDGDGLIDYPADPGCAVPNADDETDDCPSGPGCPQCANDIDDDGNGSTDYPDDPGCMSASDTTEVVDNPVACGATLMIKNLPATGTDTGTLDSTSTSQITSPCGGGGGVSAVAYRLNLPMATVIVADTAGSAFDTVLDLRSADCDDPASEVACHDDVSSSNETSKLTKSVPAGNYFLVVSGADTSEVGMYAINVQRFTGEGAACTASAQCGPGLVCRVPGGATGMVCTTPQCGDTFDDDADGKNGFPADPGCTSATDNDETDDCPTGPNCPACSNEIDDDTDGMTDYPADTSCTTAAGGSEACNGEQDPIETIVMGTTNGTLVGASNDHDASCDSSSASGPDVLYTLTVPAMRSLQIDTQGTSMDTVLSLLSSTCQEPSLACNDEGFSSFGASRITRTNVPSGTYIVAVDAYGSSTTLGTYPLNVSGIISPGGRCDPASTLGGALVCPASNPCVAVGTEMKCQPSACGDGMDNDSDNKTDFPADPGCTSLDDLDEADTCANGPGPGCPECGDGVDNDGDGNIDGADSNCIYPSTPSEGCITSEGVDALTNPVTADTTVGSVDDVALACGASANDAPDNTYSLELPAMRELTITNSNSFDATVALLNSSCAGTPITCRDEPETIAVQGLGAGTYFYVVDGYNDTGDSGAITITVSGTIETNGSCELPLAQSGALRCAAGFTCKGAVGSRTCQRAACQDGVDNDVDGVGDYPNDPGCFSATDDDESDTCPGAGCPVCADGMDNDGDGDIDYPNDSSCLSASSASEACFTSEDITALVLPATPGTLVGATNDGFASCSGTLPNTSADRVYALTVPALDRLTISNVNTFDAVTALYNTSCTGTALACSDEPENVSLTNLAAGTYYYFVDGDGATGTYTINISGTVTNGESCEGALFTAGGLTCNDGYTCAGTAGSRTCQPAQCNDGMDNDSDGATDFPADPGCLNSSDDDETDDCPSGPNCPACANDADDDGDGDIDYPDDDECTAASSVSEACVSTDGVRALTTSTVTGNTTLSNNDASPACGTSGTNSAGDDLYSITVPALSDLVITADSTWDSVVALYDGTCGGTALQCNDNPRLAMGPLAAGTYFFLIDGYGSGEGTYTANIRGRIAPGGSCEGPLATSGALTCDLDTLCLGTAGSRTCQLAACSDGMDNDADGTTDFPNDPGCSAANDNDETNLATAPVCFNTTDDDTDSTTDWPADYGCGGAGGTSEAFCPAELNPTTLITASPTTGTTTGASSQFASQSCQSSTGAEDVVLALQLPVKVDTLVLDLTASAFDTVISLRDVSCGFELGCADDQTMPSSTRSKLTVANVPAGGYAVIIDGWSTSDGAYSLTVTGTVPAGTSCSSPLFASGVLACPTGTTCTGTPLTCQ